MRYSPFSSRTRVPALLMAAGSWLLLACGDGDDAGGPEAQPVPGASTFEEGNFDQLPRFPGADAASEPAVERDVTSQSFTVATATPEQVIGFYDGELDEAGWRAVEEPQRLGAEETYRGVWREGDQELTVSATELSGFDEPGGARTTQFSLSLGPA